MSLATVRPTLIALHRWAGLILAPVFLIVILSGAVLSFRPIVGSFAPPPAATTVDAGALAPLVARLSATAPITRLSVADGGRAIDVGSADPTVAGRWDVAGGTRAAAAPAAPIDVFGIAEQIHKQLLVGLGLVVEIAAWVMLGLVLVGPFLAWLRFRNTLMGWHTAIGWVLFPLVVLAPLSGVLMTLHVGEGGTPLPRASRTVSVAEALTIAAPKVDLSGFLEARPFRGGTVMMRTGGAAPATWVVTDADAVRLTGGPSLVKQIHEGTWGGAGAGALNLAASLALLALAVSGPWSWLARRRRDRATAIAVDTDVLVVHASQTGTATRFAEATGRALAASGEKVAVTPLGTLRPEDLQRRRIVLILVSSTGDGELPDTARAFVETLAPEALAGVRCAVFALGDRSYAHFCGGAERLRTALRVAGAEEAMPPVYADGDPTSAWQSWLGDFDVRLGLKVAIAGAPAAEPRVRLTLVERRRLDDPTKGETRETWGLTLDSDRPLTFRPGDLLRIAPEAGARERSYSIGTSSRVDPRRIVLTVALDGGLDATGQAWFGAASGWLCRRLAVGDALEARLSAHPSFNPPEDPARAIVMVGAGSGVAPFWGVAAERRAAGRAGPAWLIFGNRVEAADFLWKAHFEAALADGGLTRLDTAFSPEAGVGVRVQDRLREQGAEVRRWLVEKDAIFYVCGRRALVDGVLEALADVFVAHGGLTPAAAATEIARRVAAGSVRVDAFG
ncbi:MAG: nitric oxide synthase [Phyllobacteriaceae bacterium]|nr:nitric oxide synthase [Phyllobacteriaceae bacterium]